MCQWVHTVAGTTPSVRTHRHEVGLERVATKSVVDEDVPDVIFDRHRVGRGRKRLWPWSSCRDI